MSYGKLPFNIGAYIVSCNEMMFYQYLPIKTPGMSSVIYEDRLHCFNQLVGVCCCDFIGVFGLKRFVDSYVYMTAKRMFQIPKCSFNRPGYHSDGFMTDDINYIWCDKNPTVFNTSAFKLSMDDSVSLVEMEQQAQKQNEYSFPNNSLLRLDQYNIHKVADEFNPGMRTFFKLSFSFDKYDLLGNSHNYLIDYKWEMKERKNERNIPQSTFVNK